MAIGCNGRAGGSAGMCCPGVVELAVMTLDPWSGLRHGAPIKRIRDVVDVVNEPCLRGTYRVKPEGG
jgi:hypothetical protein